MLGKVFLGLLWLGEAYLVVYKLGGLLRRLGVMFRC